VIITFLFLPLAKKLGGKLDVVSYHDEVEGEFRLKLIHDSRLFIIHLTFQYISVQGRKTHHTASVCVCTLSSLCVCFSVAKGKPPGAPSEILASETDRTYVVLSWKAPAYSSRAPMWYYIEKVTQHPTVPNTAGNRPTLFTRSGLKEQDHTVCIPANLSPFGEIHRFEIEIGHPSESCFGVGGVNWPAGVYKIGVRHGENAVWCSSQ